MTPRKPEHEKKRPGRPRKPVEELTSVSVPTRLTIADAARLDAVSDNRTEFCRRAVLAAVARAERALEKKAARAS